VHAKQSLDDELNIDGNRFVLILLDMEMVVCGMDSGAVISEA
jgi:hypothetical protein